MGISVAPGTSFEALTADFATGLTGTLGVRIRDGAGGQFLARTTSGITEDVTVGSAAVYRKTLTAPTVQGQFWIVWDNGTTLEVEELDVTHTASTPSVGGSAYISRNELKQNLDISTADGQDDADIDEAVEAASRAIDGYMKKPLGFYPSTLTRYYTPDRYADELRIDDLNTLTSLSLDFDGDGDYETTWVEGTQFLLLPENYAGDAIPANRVALRPPYGTSFAYGPKAVKIVGSFGWATTPVNVKRAARILATRIFKRRETPYGILSVVAAETVAAARLGRIDPDVAFLLDNIPHVESRPFQTLQLG